MTTLYRLSDRYGGLLYIGIAEDAAKRMVQHSRTKSWWPDVAAMTFEQHPDRASAARAERSAIKRERPAYNVIHNEGFLTVQEQFLDFLEQAGTREALVELAVEHPHADHLELAQLYRQSLHGRKIEAYLILAQRCPEAFDFYPEPGR